MSSWLISIHQNVSPKACLITCRIAKADGGMGHGVHDNFRRRTAGATSGSGSANLERLSERYGVLRRRRNEESFHGVHVDGHIRCQLELEDWIVVGTWRGMYICTWLDMMEHD